MLCLEGDSRVYTLLCHCHNLEKFLFTPFPFFNWEASIPEVEIDVLYIHPLLSINIGFCKEPLPNKGEVKETFFHVNTCWQLGCQFMSAPLLSYVHEKKVYESYWLIAIEMLDNLCASFAGCSAEW